MSRFFASRTRRSRSRQVHGRDIRTLRENTIAILHQSRQEDCEPECASPAARRQLMRLWLSVLNSQPLDPGFREHFGASEAGALRGGMRESRRV